MLPNCEVIDEMILRMLAVQQASRFFMIFQRKTKKLKKQAFQNDFSKVPFFLMETFPSRASSAGLYQQFRKRLKVVKILINKSMRSARLKIKKKQHCPPFQYFLSKAGQLTASCEPLKATLGPWLKLWDFKQIQNVRRMVNMEQFESLCGTCRVSSPFKTYGAC